MKKLILTILMCVLSSPAFAEKESAFERVMRTGEIRCGYIPWPGHIEVDPNTAKKSGMIINIMDAIAEELELKIVWAEEVGWGNFAEGLKTNRYDALCSAVWKSGVRAKMGLLTRTLFYEGMTGVARSDDNRFDESLDKLNSPDATVAVIDGDITQAIRKKQFPKSKELALPSDIDSGGYILSVVTEKADVTFVGVKILENYNKNNDKKLKKILGGKPVRMFPDSMAVQSGEHDLKAMLDAAIETLQVSGDMKRILQPYRKDGIYPSMHEAK